MGSFFFPFIREHLNLQIAFVSCAGCFFLIFINVFFVWKLFILVVEKEIKFLCVRALSEQESDVLGKWNDIIKRKLGFYFLQFKIRPYKINNLFVNPISFQNFLFENKYLSLRDFFVYLQLRKRGYVRQSNIYIALVGLPGIGKTTRVRLIAKAVNVPVIYQESLCKKTIQLGFQIACKSAPSIFFLGGVNVMDFFSVKDETRVKLGLEAKFLEIEKTTKEKQIRVIRTINCSFVSFQKYSNCMFQVVYFTTFCGLVHPKSFTKKNKIEDNIYRPLSSQINSYKAFSSYSNMNITLFQIYTNFSFPKKEIKIVYQRTQNHLLIPEKTCRFNFLKLYKKAYWCKKSQKILVCSSLSSFKPYTDVERKFFFCINFPKNMFRSSISKESKKLFVVNKIKLCSIFFNVIDKSIENLLEVWSDFESIDIKIQQHRKYLFIQKRYQYTYWKSFKFRIKTNK